MREIKFRVWDKYWKKMIYDIQNTFEENYTLGIDYFGQYLNNDKFEVMQYTGLKDCYGHDIYEGDILTNISSTVLLIIIFENGCFKAKPYNSSIKPFILHTPMTSLGVVGNIYENKNLLEN